MTIVSNNNKKYGLGKERQLKKDLEFIGYTVCRSRGSFGSFDLIAFGTDHCKLISIKSTRQKYWSSTSEINKLKKVIVPPYCIKELHIWWSPLKDRSKRGWEVIQID